MIFGLDMITIDRYVFFKESLVVFYKKQYLTGVSLKYNSSHDCISHAFSAIYKLYEGTWKTHGSWNLEH